MKNSPFHKLKKSPRGSKLPKPPAVARHANLQHPEALGPVDGRSLRRTGMTEPLYLRVQPGLRDRIKVAAARDKTTMGKLITEAFALYEAGKG